MLKFKLGLDWHGVLDAMIPEMAWLTRAIVAAGGEVHIMTGMKWTPECDVQLKEWGVHYTHTFSIRDHHDKLGTPTPNWNEKYKFWGIDDDIWDQTKADYCREHEITLCLDDTMNYLKYFTTPFGRIWTNRRKKEEYDAARRVAATTTA
jgi:hypothetical protein